MSDDTYSYYKSTGENFHCPNGHQQHYTNTESKQAREIKELKHQTEYLNGIIDSQHDTIVDLRDSLWYAERVQCPYCEKWVKDLEGHSKRMHSDEG
jgi:hypothetical protein